MKILENQRFIGERALFMSDNVKICGCTFDDGESPLKESKNIIAENCEFKWKYPFWYCSDVEVDGSTFFEMARAGIWYTNNFSLKNCTFIAPKGFRRCKGLYIENTEFTNAAETLWSCSDVQLKNVKAKGDYLLMNSENITVENLELDGNYSFDGAKNVVVKNSRLISKDAFWNSKNVTVYDSFISGEYLGWNAENLTLINCTVESLQGLCYIDNLKMVNCKTVNTTLAFEYSSVDVELTSGVDSIINPSSGIIRAESVGELILDETKINPKDTKIVIGENNEI